MIQSRGHIDYRRTDNLFLSSGASKGTSNIMVKGDNEGTDEEGDASEEKRFANVNKDPDMRFRTYEPLPYMTNIDLSIEDGLELSRLSHKTHVHASVYHDIRVLEVGIEYPNKYFFLAALK
ncbi:hypothetical protein J1N35_040535 [Gossypium stocksii]|uniref:Uncharacterized protein n=1 Tax=Gossypium stocksii TaxID=47602 RepID=A0A9D3UDR7_9ROSI|nr:hypothetical protein J1N35_040535 [Gossypium stocksii]